MMMMMMAVTACKPVYDNGKFHYCEINLFIIWIHTKYQDVNSRVKGLDDDGAYGL